MRYSISLSMDPDIFISATSYAKDKGISFSRLIHESLCAVLDQEGLLDPPVRQRVEDRIRIFPGRKKLTEEEKKKRKALREAERARKKIVEIEKRLKEIERGS